MSKAWDGGSTRAWRIKRARVLLRDGFLCRVKIGGVCTTYAPAHRGPRCALRGHGPCALCAGQAHHIHGRASGCAGCAADHPDHLIAACRACNLHVGDPSRDADPPNKGVTTW